MALRASVTRSFFSPTSTSDAPPTLMTATPPLSFASRSCSFSLHATCGLSIAHSRHLDSTRGPWLLATTVGNRVVFDSHSMHSTHTPLYRHCMTTLTRKTHSPE